MKNTFLKIIVMAIIIIIAYQYNSRIANGMIAGAMISLFIDSFSSKK